VHPGSELAKLSEQIERKYSADQPRVPVGVREGGRWTAGDGPRANWKNPGEVQDLSASSKKGGHHFVPKAVYEKMNLPEETKKSLRRGDHWATKGSKQ